MGLPLDLLDRTVRSNCIPSTGERNQVTNPKPQFDDQLLLIRKTIIAAVASDEELMDRLVLKGGNALDIVYGLGERASLDIDFSISGDFGSREELRETEIRLFDALRRRFDTIDLIVFDERLEERPRGGGGPGVTVWGGYNATFKLLPRARYYALGGTPGATPAGQLLGAMQREAMVTGPGGLRSFIIEISKFEYCEGKILKRVDEFDCFVYSPAMLATEKLRAICQQLPEYTLRRHPTPRPRDFLDIHTIEQRLGLDLAAIENHELIRHMFLAKDVPLNLLSKIGTDDNRAFHEQEWSSVVTLVRQGPLQPFAFYFDHVIAKANILLQAMTST